MHKLKHRIILIASVRHCEKRRDRLTARGACAANVDNPAADIAAQVSAALAMLAKCAISTAAAHCAGHVLAYLRSCCCTLSFQSARFQSQCDLSAVCVLPTVAWGCSCACICKCRYAQTREVCIMAHFWRLRCLKRPLVSLCPAAGTSRTLRAQTRRTRRSSCPCLQSTRCARTSMQWLCHLPTFQQWAGRQRRAAAQLPGRTALARCATRRTSWGRAHSGSLRRCSDAYGHCTAHLRGWAQTMHL